MRFSKEHKTAEISLFLCCIIIRGLDKIRIGEYTGIKAVTTAERVKGDLIINLTNMFFKKKKEEVSLDQKIKKARRIKRIQLVAMYLIGFLGGSGWIYSSIEGSNMWKDLTGSKTVVIVNEARAQEVSKEVVLEKPWQSGEFSAYTASVDETDANPLVMASGKMVYVGALACPVSMKFGTKIEVRGVGEFTCEDRMNSRYGDGHFDIFKMTKDEAKKFGRKALEYREI